LSSAESIVGDKALLGSVLKKEEQSEELVSRFCGIKVPSLHENLEKAFAG
jgi:hypothetical protein